MKRYKTKLIYCITLFLSSLSLNALIIEGFIWRKWNPTINDFTYIYCLGDMHEAREDINQKHQEYILNALEQRKAHETLIITEDSTSYHGADPFISKLYNMHISPSSQDIFSTDSTIEYLIHNSIRRGYRACNTECRIPFFLPELLLIKKIGNENIFSWAKKALTTKILIQAYKKIKNDLIACNRHPLDTYYRTVFQNFDCATEQLFTIFAQDNNSLHDFMYNHHWSSQRMKQFCYLLKSIGNELPDLYALHAIAHQQQYKHVFVVMGYTHTQTINQLIKQLGFEEIYIFKNSHTIQHSRSYTHSIQEIFSQIINKNVSDDTIETMMKPIIETIYTICTISKKIQPIDDRFWEIIKNLSYQSQNAAH